MSFRPAAPLWRNTDLVKILIGETISDVGSQVGGLALPFTAALTLQATPGEMAALAAAEYVPPMVVGLVAGAWIDRQPRRPLLIGANLARALVLAIVASTSGRVRRHHSRSRQRSARQPSASRASNARARAAVATSARGTDSSGPWARPASPGP